jgi:hypothetical protein
MFNIAANGSSGYNLTNSLRFRSSASAASTAYLTRTPASNTNRTTWTWSGWVKRAFISSSGETTLFGAAINSGDRILISFYQDKLLMYAVSGGVASDVSSAAVYRDPSAWYHVVVAMDTTQATASNRSRLYINGTEITSFATSTRPNQNQTFAINSTNQHQIGRNFDGTSQVNFMDGYLAEVNFIDGQALTPSSFGSTNATTGVWQPAKYTGTYGTNGFYLNFNSIALTSGSNTGLGKDNSGNGNYWNTNNISVTSGTTYDAMTDVPTLTSATVANYATLNPLDTSGKTISNANLTFANTASAGVVKSTIGMSSGKWYCEYVMTSGTDGMIGICLQSASNTMSYLGSTADGWCYRTDASRYNNGTRSAPYGATWAANDIIGIAFDADTGSLTFYKNGASQGVAYSGLAAGTYVFAGGQNTTFTGNFNFGQRPFTYTPPTGFVALNTFNLPTPTILQGNKYMDATLYTGTNATLSITNAGAFKPDLLWFKRRSSIGNHQLMDSVRGVTKVIDSNTTGAEQTSTAGTGLTSINSNGFTLGTDTTTDGYTNTSGFTFVTWQWQAGQGSTSSNTSGTITSTVSVNTTAGFSIATYTGTGSNATVGHGLGVAPKMIFVKARNNANGWIVWHTSLTSGAYFLDLQGTSGQTLGTDVFQSTIPNSTVVTLGTNVNTNRGSGNFLIYSWAEIAGFSKFGSYTGNGSADGPFVYTGFRPKFILYKNASTATDWVIWDTIRNTYNIVPLYLLPNSSVAEGSSAAIDILSNGFKIRITNATNNASGNTYVYMAFAENPFKYSNAR